MTEDVDFFIAYARADRPAAERLYKFLSREAKVFLDVHSLQPGDQWDRALPAAQRQSDVTVVLISPATDDAFYTREEVAQAIDLARKGSHRLVPVWLAPRESMPVPYGLRTRHGIEVGAECPLDEVAERLLNLLPTSTHPHRAEPEITFSVEQGDLLAFDTDIAAFKYAQGFHGADAQAARALVEEAGVPRQRLEPAVGERRLVATRGCIQAPEALFVGLPDLYDISYEDIRNFGQSVVEEIAAHQRPVKRLAMTIHGPGIGLDDIEAFLAQFAGCNQALLRSAPAYLRSIVFVELDMRRVERLASALEQALHDLGRFELRRRAPTIPGWDLHVGTSPADDVPLSPRPAGEKPHVFVAMPFAEDWDDVYHFGIQEPVRACGLVCERIDQENFTGEVLARLRQRIESSALVIAELSDANPNVYLEVGYAWGSGRPTVLLLREGSAPAFDVAGHKHLRYSKILELRAGLGAELQALKAQGEIRPAQ